jgi:hypothetical protein
MRVQNSRRLSYTAIAAGLTTSILIGTGAAHAAPVQPGTTTPTNTTQPGTTAPEPAPAAPAPAPAAEPAGGEVPNYASQAVPGINQVAQPLQQAGPQVVSEPEIVYVQGEPQIQYVDRIVDRPVEVVEENGTLLLLDPEYQNQIRPEKVVDDAVGNYWAYDQSTRNTLNTTAGAAGAGAVGGALVGGAIGAIGTGTTGAVAGGIAGAAAAPIATAPLCAIGAVLVPVAGGVSCVVTAAATGAAGGAIVGGAAGAGAGLVAGSATGAGLGAAGAASLVPGGTEAVQDLVADTAHDTETDLRTDNGFRGLVGNKPSGLPGEIPAEESTDTRNVDGTTIGGAQQEGRHAAEDTTPAPAPQTQNEPRHAAPEVPEIPQELPAPVQQVNAAIDNAQEQANNFVLEAQDQAPSFDTIPNLGDLLPV